MSTTCHCGQPATRQVAVSTIPGNGYGKLVTMPVCDACYVLEGWADVDLSAQRDMWELALGETS